MGPEGTVNPDQDLPKFATVDQVDSLTQILQDLRTTVQTLATGFNAVQADRTVKHEAAPANPYPTVSPKQLREALENGDYEAYEQLSDAKQKHAQWEQDQRWEGRIAQLQTVGLESIAGIRQDLTAQTLPYYAKYKGEIDKFVAGLSPEQRLQPGVYKMAHDMVVGSHIAEIQAEAVEKETRKAAPQVNTPGRSTRVVEVTPENEIEMDDDMRDELEYKGMEPDSFARRLGYKSWKDYQTKTKGEAA